MEDNVGKLYILNDELVPSDKPKIADERKAAVVYEVIRIIDGAPLFLKDHYIRLHHSLSLMGIVPKSDQNEFENLIFRLLEANRQTDCNVKIIVYADTDGQDKLLYISRSYYPPKEIVESGVKVSLLKWERTNPNVKVVNNIYKEAVAKSIKESGAFEVLLTDNSGRITEGSRSNTFFVRDGMVYTAPEEYILKGVTRKYIIEACSKIGIRVKEELISVDELDRVEGIFISGTSIKVLPVSRVNNMKYNSAVHPLIVSIRDEFDNLIRNQIDMYK